MCSFSLVGVRLVMMVCEVRCVLCGIGVESGLLFLLISVVISGLLVLKLCL